MIFGFLLPAIGFVTAGRVLRRRREAA